MKNLIDTRVQGTAAIAVPAAARPPRAASPKSADLSFMGFLPGAFSCWKCSTNVGIGMRPRQRTRCLVKKNAPTKRPRYFGVRSGGRYQLSQMQLIISIRYDGAGKFVVMGYARLPASAGRRAGRQISRRQEPSGQIPGRNPGPVGDQRSI